MEHLLFVYGTLKRGFSHHEKYLGRSVLISRAETSDAYPMVLCSERYYPVMIDAMGSGQRVQGELYRVDAALIDNLDVLERVNERDGYQRRRLSTTLPDGAIKNAWCYIKAPAWVEDVRSDSLSHYDDARYVPRDDGLD
ncbi:gamma-glutamylcyclotransferase family protein [Billgrantia endophytica]|uniref:Gamma-glutamylcyclotransferase family protein n=1 Tax=Billgrantia endophytica TaxID=2033802 RepID=A0A2N7UBY0_9GAMM|nr:gamma-glutamylcyclotransferase family protein [Halomonas endophytica]PMR77901.1 gamma-glutamylcyclotransferase [Halomonas endophytica]